MEIVILIGIPLLVLLIAWLQDINSKNNNLRSDSSSVRRYKQILEE